MKGLFHKNRLELREPASNGKAFRDEPPWGAATFQSWKGKGTGLVNCEPCREAGWQQLWS